MGIFTRDGGSKRKTSFVSQYFASCKIDMKADVIPKIGQISLNPKKHVSDRWDRDDEENFRVLRSKTKIRRTQ